MEIKNYGKAPHGIGSIQEETRALKSLGLVARYTELGEDSTPYYVVFDLKKKGMMIESIELERNDTNGFSRETIDKVYNFLLNVYFNY